MKPKEGDIVRVTNPTDSLGDEHAPTEWKVIQVHDSLDESWDPYGEHAWSQGDHDKMVGKKGKWYVICETDNPGDGTCSFASYECKLVK